MRASRGPVLRSLGGAFEELFAEARCDLDRPVWKIAPAVVVAEDRFPKRARWPHNVRQRHALVLDARARVSLRSVPHQVVERAPLPGGFYEIIDRRDQVRFQDFAISLADALERRDERLRRREWMGITAALNLQPFSIFGLLTRQPLIQKGDRPVGNRLEAVEMSLRVVVREELDVHAPVDPDAVEHSVEARPDSLPL